MLEQEISMTEMIQYLKGEASPALRDHIELRVKNDPEFAEEVEMWREYLEEQGDTEGALEQMADFSDTWQNTEVTLPQSVAPHEADIRPLQPETPIRSLRSADTQAVKKTPWRYVALAVAAVVVLLVLVIPPFSGAGDATDYQVFAEAEISSGIENLIGVTQGSEEEFDRMMRNRIKAGAYVEAKAAVDSLLNQQPSIKYSKLSALLLAANGQMDAATEALQGLRKDPDLSPDDYCNITWQLAMVHYQTGNQAALTTLVKDWSNPDAQVPCYTLSPANNQQLEKMIQAPR